MSATGESWGRVDVMDRAMRRRAEGTPAVAAPVRPSAKAEMYAKAERQMRQGKRLIFIGFAVAVVGIVAYCVVCLSAAVNQDLGATLLDRPGWLVGPMLGIIGLGTLLWIIGSFLFLSGGMDSDPETPDRYL